LLRRGLDVATAGIAIWCRDGRLEYANRAFVSTFGIARGSAGELSYVDFVSQLAASSEVVLATATTAWVERQLAAFGVEADFSLDMADGRSLEVVHRPLGDGGMTVTVNDVSSLKRTEVALRRAKELAETSDEAKSRFLRAANHDLRQPLATLRILIFNCLGEKDETHRKELFHAMDISVSVMEDLLSALLQIGQLDAGQITPRVTTFQLAQVMERLAIQFAHQARDKGLGFRLVSTRAAVVTDKALLERILANVVSNAIRYTDVGNVLIGCRRVGGALRIEIRDTGRGIAPEHQERIFEEFYQVPDARRVKRPGLGLGLNIAYRIARLLDHKLELRSRPGHGSVFSLTVPFGDVWQSEAPEPEISEMIGGEFAGKIVLLVEDDDVLRRAMQELLERWGIRVIPATSEAQVREYIEGSSQTPDLIIADYSLRGQVGTQVVEGVRKAFEEAIPAIIVTADAAPEVSLKIASAGLPMLIKPVSPPRLRVMMHNLLFEPGVLAAASSLGGTRG
jgi:signal transduction histidine kinase/CheY-like chemotaxis protein